MWKFLLIFLKEIIIWYERLHYYFLVYLMWFSWFYFESVDSILRNFITLNKILKQEKWKELAMSYHSFAWDLPLRTAYQNSRILGDRPTSRVVIVIGPRGSGPFTPPTIYWPSAHPVCTLIRDPSVKEVRMFERKRKVYWERKFPYLFDVLWNYLWKWICEKIVVLTEPLTHEYFSSYCR